MSKSGAIFSLEESQKIAKTIEEMKSTDQFAVCEPFEIYRSPSGGFYVVPHTEDVDQGGSSSKVMKAVRIDQVNPWKLNNVSFLLKATKLGDEKIKIQEIEENFKREASALQASISFDDKDKVEAFEILKEDSQMGFLTMEFFPGKTLFKIGEKIDLMQAEIPYQFDVASLTVPQIFNLSDQIAESLYNLHQSGYCHGDVSNGNILLTPERAQLIDFGTARKVGAENKILDIGIVEGTPGYLAPEVFLKKKSIPADYYSLGGVIACLFSDGKNNPFQDKFIITKKYMEKKTLQREVKKYELYIATSFADIDLKNIKEDAVLLYRDSAEYKAVFVKNGKLELFSNYSYVVVDEKPAEAKDNSFAIYFKPERGVAFYHEGKEVPLSKESQNILLNKVKAFSSEKAMRTLLTNEDSVKKDLMDVLRKEAKTSVNIVRVPLDFSGQIEAAQELFELKEPQKKVLNNSSLTEYIVREALRAKPLNLRMGQDSEGNECKALYNLDGFFKGDKFKDWQWAKPYFENYMLRLQEKNPMLRPRALENRLFFGVLHYLGNDEKHARPMLLKISNKGFARDKSDQDLKIFTELAADFFTQVQLHPEWKPERLQQFFKTASQFFINKDNKVQVANQLIDLIYLTSERMSDLQKIIPESFQQCYEYYKKYLSHRDLFAESLSQAIRLQKPLNELKNWGEKGQILWEMQTRLIAERRDAEVKVLSTKDDALNLNARNKLEILDTFLEIFAKMTKVNRDERVQELSSAVHHACNEISKGKLVHGKMSFFTKKSWSVTNYMQEKLEQLAKKDIRFNQT